jgi:hypothetical protein
LIGTTEYLALWTGYRMNQYRYNRLGLCMYLCIHECVYVYVDLRPLLYILPYVLRDNFLMCCNVKRGLMEGERKDESLDK